MLIARIAQRRDFRVTHLCHWFIVEHVFASNAFDEHRSTQRDTITVPVLLFLRLRVTETVRTNQVESVLFYYTEEHYFKGWMF